MNTIILNILDVSCQFLPIHDFIPRKHIFNSPFIGPSDNLTPGVTVNGLSGQSVGKWYGFGTSHRDEILRNDRDDKEELRIEVKGTQSSGSEVNLTKNEVFNARNFNTTLFVVHNIKVNRENKKASGGEKKIIKNWNPRDKDLVALTYKYKIN